MKRLALIVAASVLSILAIAVPLSAQQYTVTDLGTLGGEESKAFAINAVGQVIGYSSNPSGEFHAFMWDGTMHDLGVIFGANLKAPFAIDDTGSIYGLSYNYGDLSDQAFRWQSGVVTFLGNFSARGANASGQVVGFQSVAGTNVPRVDHACLWQLGSVTDLGTLGGANSYAMDINTAGQVVGSSFLADETTSHACLWRNWAAVDLGTLGGKSSQAVAINDSGWIAGYSDTAAGAPHACLFKLDALGNIASRTDLGDLGAGYSYASGLNEQGQIVGTSGRAFLWQNGLMSDLNMLVPTGSGWKLAYASGINNYGQIVGWGMSPAGELHAFLLTPASGRIVDARSAAAGAPVTVKGGVVTAAFYAFFYVESPDRSSGIMVDKASHGITVGQTVDVAGTMGTNAGGERYIAATSVTAAVTGSVTPLCLANAALGGGPFRYNSTTGAGQQGIAGALGLNNIGLLVRTTGKVSANDATSFFIDDGSAGNVLVLLDGGAEAPAPGNMVSVTGISSCDKSVAGLTRLLRLRGPGDITPAP